MYKEPKIFVANPVDKFFVWQCNLYVESCINVGFKEENINILLYKPKGRDENKKEWDMLKNIYPKLNIFVYEDRGVQQYLGTYIPILRPHVLWQHFEKFPELENETILYTDCDILWTEKLDIFKLFDDNTCYISDAKSYLNVDYFNSKTKDVLPEKLEQYKKRDVVQELCDIVGINKKIVIENNNNTGGVQYILKGMSSKMWKKIEEDVLSIRVHLQNVNKEFFKNESSGIQSWCADLWAVLYNLWYFNKDVKVVNEMIFSWATDPISRISEVGIFHNAGVTGNIQDGMPFFYKGKYINGATPYSDHYLNVILNDERTQQKCTWWYAMKIRKLSEKYNLI